MVRRGSPRHAGSPRAASRHRLGLPEPRCMSFAGVGRYGCSGVWVGCAPWAFDSPLSDLTTAWSALMVASASAAARTIRAALAARSSAAALALPALAGVVGTLALALVHASQ